MAISKVMEKAAEEQDLDQIYSSFYAIALSDPGFSTEKFEEAFNYVKRKNIPGFLKQFDGEPLKSEEEWNEDYWSILMSKLMDNFCEERIMQLKQIGRKLYGRKKNIEEPQQEEPRKAPEEQKKTQNQTAVIIVAVIILIVILVVVFSLGRP